MTEPKKPKEKPETEPEIGYGCICGWKTTDKVAFTSHCMFESQKEGKGTHKSLGRIDMETGEVVMPPEEKRSAEEKKKSKYKVKTAADSGGGGGGGAGGGGGGDNGGGGGGGGGGGAKTQTLQGTKELADAQQLRMVPKVFTAGYTPIMRIAQDAAVRYFGWRPDMPFENFIDTVLYYYFLEKGITLVGYVVDDSLKKEVPDNGS